MPDKFSVSEYKFADITVDPADFRVCRSGVRQKLTPRAFEVLRYLVEHRGRTIEKQEIFEQIWREQFVSDNALTRIVKEIRQALGDDAHRPRYIETVPKRGYRFIAEVEETKRVFETGADSTGTPARRADEIDKNAVAPPRRNRLFFMSVLLLGAGLLLGGWLFFKFRESGTPPAVARTSQVTRWAGLDNFPALSADGRLLAYSSDQSGSFEIYVKPLATDAKEIQITADGNQNFQPAFAPDASRIAFHSKKRGGIWVAPASGGTARQLTTFGTNPEFSPDGKQIAFQSGALTDLGAASRTIPPSVIWTVAADGGEPRQLTEAGNPVGGHGAPVWSPDGARVAFNVEDSSSFGFWSVRVADGALQKISADGFDPVYAPDGKRLYYASFNGLWQIPVSASDDRPAGEAAQLTDDGPAQIRGLSVSKDGKKIVYGMLMSKSGLASVVLDARGEPAGLPTPFLQNSAFRNTAPSFSPDGNRLIYTTWQAGARGRLWIAGADGQNPTELTDRASIHGWFADRERVGYVSNSDGTSQFWSISAATGAASLLYTFNGDVDFARLSPDGKEIAFNSKENGTINVWIANLETGATRQLTHDSEFAGFPVWSPDGKALAVQIKRGDDTHIALISAAGGESRQLTADSGQSWVYSFSPDGEKIVYAGQRDDVWNVYAVSRATGEQKKLTGYDRLNAYVRYPAWSPRGDKIVFEYAETTGNIWLTELK
ncbi:MAG TPA: winged helix-turn-helix domain-containing protein [Pyrinomonadaceae bacterium]|jgi:Tol biopolymer transport system component/DNA-binding winged helix-turn-helix (wHTH) protein